MVDGGDPQGIPFFIGEGLPEEAREELINMFLAIETRLDQIQGQRGWLKTRYVEDDAEPTPNEDEIVLWKDTANVKYYLVVNFRGTVKKEELT